MDRRTELKFFWIAMVGLLVSQSPIVVWQSVTLGLIGSFIFVFAFGGMYFDDFKGVFDPSAQ